MKKPKRDREPRKPAGPKAEPAKTDRGASDKTMDRAALKGIAGQLNGAGSAIKVLKGDTDEQLQRKVNDAIRQLPSAEVAKKLESIDPNKLVNVLKLDCLGVFVDFSDVSCIRCADASQCVSRFIVNLKGGMGHLKAAMVEGGQEPRVSVVAASAGKPAAATRYEPDRLVFVKDVPNPNPAGDDYHATIQRVLDDQPETLAELRAIVEQDFDVEGDGDFMKFVTALRDPKEGVIKLDVDLSDKDREALKKAGYDV